MPSSPAAVARRRRTAGLPPRARRVLSSPALAALAWPHSVSRYLELVNPLWSLDEDRAIVTAVVHETADTVTLTLRPTRWEGFRAGQHLLLTVEIDGQRHTRTYSPASSARRRDGQIELVVKAHPHGRVSQHLVSAARPGLVVTISQPFGEVALPDTPTRPLLLISGGSGITPMLAMLRTLVDDSHAGPVRFLHFAPTADDLVARDELATIAARHPNIQVDLVATRATSETRRHLTRADLPDDLDAWTAFACGPIALLDATRSLFDAAGASDLWTEPFATPPTAPAEDATGTLRLAGAGAEVANDGRTILAQAEAAGLTPSAGCRMGICHTCVRRKPAGTVRNTVSGALCSDDTDIQICVSVPVGDVTIDL